MRRRAPISVLLIVFAGLLPALAEAGKKKVYRYQTADGKTDVGTEVPDGATILEVVGEVETDDPWKSPTGDEPLSLPDVSLDVDTGALGERARADLDRVMVEMLERPVEAALFGVGLLLWAWLLLLLFPPIFKTLELGPRQAFNMLASLLAAVAAFALVGWLLEFLWPQIRWRPSDSFGERPLAVLVGLLLAAITVYVFKKRFGVGVGTAVLFAAAWLGLVVGVGVVAWLYLLPLVRG